jgi:hypothetical protein
MIIDLAIPALVGIILLYLLPAYWPTDPKGDIKETNHDRRQ